MARATPWLNRRAREALGQRLRTNSEFDAFLLDHFEHVLPVIPSKQATRLDRETALLQRVGAHAVLQALCGPRYYAAWLLMAVAMAPTERLYRQSRLWALTLPLAGLLYSLMTFDSARRHWLGRGGTWKGRVGAGKVAP